MLLEKARAQRALAEVIGTFVVVFAGCGTIVVGRNFPGTVPNGAAAIIFGLTVTTMIYAVGHVSGAHFNPAVTLAFAVVRHFPLRDLPLYWVAQAMGATLAALAMQWLLPDAGNFGMTVANVSAWQALGLEAVITFILMFVVMGVATDTRALGTMAGVAVGAVVAFNALLAGPVTGASMNPVRSLLPALFAGNFENLWVYLVGPTVGALLGAFTYEWIRCEDTPTKSENAKGCC